MRATKFDPQRADNSSNPAPGGQPQESPGPVSPPAPAEPQYRSTAPAAPVPRFEPSPPQPPPPQPSLRPAEPQPRPRPFEPQARPAEPRPRPFEPQARPAEPRPRPFEPQARPAEPRPRPFEPQARPAAPAMPVPQYRSTAPTAPRFASPPADIDGRRFQAAAPPPQHPGPAPRAAAVSFRPPPPATVAAPAVVAPPATVAAPAAVAPPAARAAAAPPPAPVPGQAAPLPAARYGPGLPAMPPRVASPVPSALIQERPAAPPPPPVPRQAGPLPAARFGPGLPAAAPPVASPVPSALVQERPAAPAAAPLRPAPRYGGPGLPPAPAPRPASGPAARPVAATPPPAPTLRPARPGPAAALEVGRLRYEDLPAIVELVNADLLPGQPACDRHALDAALRGESPVDASWWRELANVQAVVARRGGAVVGAASYAIAPADRSGWLLWLHAGENRVVVEALVDHVFGELTGSSHQYAFWIATALSLGLEALPVEQRPVTHEVLQSRGLTGRDSWRYLVVPVDRTPIEGAPEEVALAVPASGPGEIPAWRLLVGDRQQPMASAEIALAADGCGVLWWIDVEPAARGRGVGRRLLRQAVRFLAMRGARTVAALVDHADPGDRDPRPVLHLLGSAGFQEVDRLWSYESPRRLPR